MPESESCCRRLSQLIGLALILSGRPLAAQSSFEITPFLASFYALTSVNKQTDVPLPSFGGSPPGDIVREQQDGPMIGARVSFPLTGIIRAEGSVGYAFSDGRLAQRPRNNPEAGFGVTSSAHVYMVSARALFRPRRQNFYGIAGVGLVGRGGTFWDGADQSPRFSGVLGFGVRAAVSPRLSLNFSAEAFLYSFSYSSSNVANSQSKFQQDIVVAIGVPIGAR